VNNYVYTRTNVRIMTIIWKKIHSSIIITVHINIKENKRNKESEVKRREEQRENKA
jgi:hypothetical protein